MKRSKRGACRERKLHRFKSSHSPALSPPEPRCPVCRTQIDQQLFQLYTGGRRVRLAIQFALCKAHKQKTARVEWTSSGYPTIDWKLFPERLSDFNEIITKIIDNGIPSRYRNEFDHNIRIQNIHRRLWEQIESPQMAGYYGPRGHEIM